MLHVLAKSDLSCKWITFLLFKSWSRKRKKMMSPLLEHSPSWRTKGSWNCSFQSHLRKRKKKKVWKQQRYRARIWSTLSFSTRELKASGEYFRKKWPHCGEREVDKGQVLVPTSSLTEMSRQCLHGVLKSWTSGQLPFLWTTQRLWSKKKGVWVGYQQDNPVAGRILGNMGDKGSEDPFLHLSPEKSRSPRIIKCYSS